MQVKSVKTGSVFWAACTSLSYFYMVSKIRNKHFVYEELYVVFLVDLVSQSLIVLKSWSFYSLSTSPCWKEKQLTQTAVGYFFFVLLKGLCYKNTAVFLFYSVGQFYAEVQLF